MSDRRPIGVFDSGIGGLTVVKEIFKRLPNERIVYFGDTARVPYGGKSPRVVEKFAIQDASFLMRHQVKCIVVACHTASSVALETLENLCPVPTLGVVLPGVEAAVRATRSFHIGVIGTKGTILSQTYVKQLTHLNPDIRVTSQACPLFVPLAEEGWLEGDVTGQVARIYLNPLKEDNVDTLILGCTHYPLLKPVITEIMGTGVQLIDSAEETARAVERCLDEQSIRNLSEDKPEHAFFVSDIPHQFKEIGERFLEFDLHHVEQIDPDTLDDV